MEELLAKVETEVVGGDGTVRLNRMHEELEEVELERRSALGITVLTEVSLPTSAEDGMAREAPPWYGQAKT